MTGPLVAPIDDQATRALAQDEFSKPLIVEAGAGTGKTALLVARVAAWCIGAGWERHLDPESAPEKCAGRVIEGVVAITFTEAAAAEMAHRIGEALSGLARGENPVGWISGKALEGLDDDEVAVRATALCGEIHRLSVTTIHSFCQRVLAAHPFEVGLHPHFEIDADGSVLEALVDEVVEEALRELDQSPSRGDWERLAVRDVGPARVAEALRLLVEAGAQPGDFEREPFDEATAMAVAGELSTDLADFFAVEDGRLVTVARNAAAEKARAALQTLADELDRLQDRVAFLDLLEAVTVIEDAHLKRFGEWSRKKFTQGERGALGDATDEVAVISGRLANRLKPLLGLDIEGFAAARRVLALLLTEIEYRRRTRGIATFSDLLSSTALLFEGHDEICRAERRRMDQLLVDEFQDTDDVQCRIVARLALDGPEDERPGLFVVGDPKQSIYAWRSADLAAYDAFVDGLLARGGVRGPLTRNFRSVRPILDEVERVVAPVMHREPGFQPSFEALEATGELVSSPGFNHLPWSAVEHWVTWPRGEDGVPSPIKAGVQAITELEARAIAVDIRRLHDEAGVRFGDIAVLLRATTKQGEILEAFREMGVPFDVAREREYFQQREIIEAAALVRTVLEPADALALLTVIRSDSVGVPDVALAPLWDAGLPGVVSRLGGDDDAVPGEVREVIRAASAETEEGPGSDLVPHWPNALVGALENLAELRRSMRDDPPDDFVEKMRTLWLAEVSAGARHLGRFRQSRLDSFYAGLEQTLRRSAGGSAELARFLRRAVEEGREAPSVSEPDREADAVHVMTIYGAKGLDFEHVYLAQIHKTTGGFGSSSAVLRRFEGAAELSLFGWSTPNFVRAEDRRELQAGAERVRLLYVAMTRAKRRLVVSGGWAAPGEIVDPLSASNLADLIAHRGDPEVIGDLIERGVHREAGTDPCVSWVIPVLDDLQGVAGAPLEGGGLRIDEDEIVEADAVAIATARRAAGERMAGRWTSPASDAAHRSAPWMETEVEEETANLRSSGGRSAAAAVGTAVHNLLENLNLESELAGQVAEMGRAAIDDAVAGLDPGSVQLASERLGKLLIDLTGSESLRRLQELAPAVIARELPVFLRPSDTSGTSVVSGAVDLVYGDPDDGRLVVADYKTDRVEGDDITRRVEKYRPQLEIYADALEEALDLDHRPHTELWFLHPDRIVRLS